MGHNLRHTILRGNTFYYNRRVPKCCVASFGRRVVKIRLSDDYSEAKLLGELLTEKLDRIWSSPNVTQVSSEYLLKTIQPRTLDLQGCLEAYLDDREIDQKPVRLAVKTLVRIAGNKNISHYDRSDARLFVQSLLGKGNKTATVRRRIQSIRALLEFGYRELDDRKRNPFSRLSIAGEGNDALKRGIFTENQLRLVYSRSFEDADEPSLALPILGETGARLAEIVGLRWEDVCFSQQMFEIRPHKFRRLKTKSSARNLPIVGTAKSAFALLNRKTGADKFVFPGWFRGGCFDTNSASNILNKRLAKSVEGLTCHCFRHTIRDRLRNAGAPVDFIDQIGGWSSSQRVGVAYGHGYNIDVQRMFMEKIQIWL